MATNFPTSLDALTNPQGTDSVQAVPHAAQHANANDAIEALEAKVGANNSAVTTSLDYRIRTLESASVDTEAIQDIVGGMVTGNTETNIVVDYNDTTGKLNFSTGADVVTTTSLNNTLTHPTTGYIPVSDVGNPDGIATLGPDGFIPASELNITETIQDTTALMLTSATHSNITVAYDDSTGRLALTGIPLTQEQEPFLESRAAATRLLPESIQYVFPIQEDFLLERQPLQEVIQEAAQLLDETSVSSIRLMPSPGPKGSSFGDTPLRVLGDADDYIFTYQATLWRREAYQEFMDDLIKYININYNPTKEERFRLQIQTNVAETEVGRSILKGLHLAWPRAGAQKNAVYLSPWPYRPTAVVQGRLETWAIDLAEREGVSLEF